MHGNYLLQACTLFNKKNCLKMIDIIFKPFITHTLQVSSTSLLRRGGKTYTVAGKFILFFSCSTSLKLELVIPNSAMHIVCSIFVPHILTEKNEDDVRQLFKN